MRGHHATSWVPSTVGDRQQRIPALQCCPHPHTAFLRFPVSPSMTLKKLPPSHVMCLSEAHQHLLVAPPHQRPEVLLHSPQTTTICSRSSSVFNPQSKCNKMNKMCTMQSQTCCSHLQSQLLWGQRLGGSQFKVSQVKC
jgi:hypothetical protein